MLSMDGSLVIDKPPGLTSHDVVAQVRHILNERRVGHTGTLDPFATGVLVILVGRATRLAQFLSGLEKEYEAVIRLGYATDTGDITGKPIEENAGSRSGWSKDEIEGALESLRGEIDQVPPMYSAKKQGGKKLYELARQGVEVERKAVRVCIHRFETIGADTPKDNLDATYDLKVRVECSAGTYVRTLAEDFGKRLQVGAHVAELRRTRVGDFNIQQANALEQLKMSLAEEAIGSVLLTPDQTLSRLHFVDLGHEDLKRVRHGMPVQIADATWSDGEHVRMRDEHEHLIAVGSFNHAASLLHPSVVLARDE